MFGEKHKTTGLTYIANDTKMKGDTEFSGDALIGGQLIGTVVSNCNITIEEDGCIEGDLQCKEISISGSFNGKLKCDKLTITTTGHFDGEVNSDSIEIFEGGQFVGSRTTTSVHKAEIPNCEAVNVTRIEHAQEA